MAAVVSVGWSSYLQAFLHDLGIDLDYRLVTAPVAWDPDQGGMVGSGAFMNLPAMLIGTIITILLVLGIKESSTVNAVAVFLKVGVILLFILVGCASHK